MAKRRKYIRYNVPASIGRWRTVVFFALAASFTLACGGGPFPTVTEFPKEARRPDGVVLEPPVTLPDSALRSDTEVPVSTLHEPLDERSLVALVRGYFHAWEHEDLDGLGRILSEDATLLGRSGGRAIETFRARIRLSLIHI